MMVLRFMGFTLPPECAAYWVGVGQPTLQDREKRLRNRAARLLKAHPQTLIPGKPTCCAIHAHLDAPL